MNLAIVSNPETAIAWPKVLISKGQIAPVDSATAMVNEEGNIIFNWMDNAGTGTAKGNDKAVLVAYFPESKEAVYQFSDATRDDGYACWKWIQKKALQKRGLAF